jgi:uncharacterized protein YndB with AHSA1/START domain
MDEPGLQQVVLVQRIIPVARRLIWEAWTNVEHFVRWSPPDETRLEVLATQPGPGEFLKFILYLPGGMKYPGKILHHKIAAPERLVYDDVYDNGLGSLNFRANLTLVPAEVGTAVSLRLFFGPPRTADITYVPMLHQQALARLERYLR